MEIKTLEEFFIDKFETLEAENVELMEKMHILAQENSALRKEIDKAKAFMSEYLSVQLEAFGHNGERFLSLSMRADELFACGKEEKAKAAAAIEYALSMGAKDETKTEQTSHEDAQNED